MTVPQVGEPRGLLRLTTDPIGDLVEDAIGNLCRPFGEPVVEDLVRCRVALVMPSDLRRRSTSGVCLEGGPHGAMCVVKSRTGGPLRDAERLGDLDQGVAQEVVHHEDRPLVGR